MIPNTPIERAIVELNGLINSILEKRKKELEKNINLLDGLENEQNVVAFSVTIQNDGMRRCFFFNKETKFDNIVENLKKGESITIEKL